MGRRTAAAAAAAVTTGLAATVATLGAAVPAYAGGAVTVEGVDFPDPAQVQLSYVGCGSLYDRAGGTLQPMVGRGPGDVPLGERSLGFAPGAGMAAGALFTVGSMTGTASASLEVNAVGHSTGVAYAGYQSPDDAGTSYLWLGRSELSTPGGAWQSVSAIGRDYTWTRYDLATGEPVGDAVGTATVADFTAAHGGDGPGIYTIGFGCDGGSFSVDAFRLGATTYDLEGLTTSVTAAAATDTIDPGDTVKVTGQLRTATGDGIGHATMILESRKGSGEWQQVRVVDVDGTTATATVSPAETTSYRWRFVDRPLAEGSESEPVTVHVRGTDASDPADPTASPSTSPSTSPSSTPTTPSSPTAPSGTTSASPSETPASSSASPASPSASPSESPATVESTPHATSDSASAAPSSGSASPSSAAPSSVPSAVPSSVSAASAMSTESSPGR